MQQMNDNIKWRVGYMKRMHKWEGGGSEGEAHDEYREGAVVLEGRRAGWVEQRDRDRDGGSETGRAGAHLH